MKNIKDTKNTIKLQNNINQINQDIINNTKLVKQIAYKYKSFGIPLEDLVSEGYIGLIKAAQRFDASKNCSLKTYAAIWIKSCIMQYIIDNWSLVRFATTNQRRNMFFKDASFFGKDSSLNKTNDDGQEFINLLPSNDNIEDDFIVKEEKIIFYNTIEKTLDNISPRNRDIFISRNFQHKPLTLESLADKHGISKERVRQIENEVYAELRNSELVSIA